MFCSYCNGTGYIIETVQFIYDGGYLPDYQEVPCACNPDPTDFDYPADFDVVEVDYDRVPYDYVLPAGLLA